MTAEHPTALALQAVADERARQVNEEKYNRAHDNGHVDGALALAAAAYIGHALKAIDTKKYGPQDGFEDDVDMLMGMCPWSIRFKSGRDSLVKAAALLIAEIERRDRL
jgi:hypothetical protein